MLVQGIGRFVLFSVLFFSLGAESAPRSASEGVNSLTGPGISLALAKARKRQLSGISYKLKFFIPEKSEEKIEAEESLHFEISNTRAPVILDTQLTHSNPMVLKTVQVNGQPFDVNITDDHLVIPQNLLRVGANFVESTFVAGEVGLHRRDNFLYTLFVPDNASKTFPCFDQPDLKARYQLSLQIPRDWKAVSQGSIKSSVENGKFKTVEFTEAKPTSTYLFAFAAGLFKTIEREIGGRKMTLYHLETNQKKVDRNVDAIFEMHSTALTWMETYIGIPYPFEKFDFVLVPAFPFSGMEHPGSIFYSDKSLFLDESATRTQILNRANVIAHETSHMWFGDLVTMEWFNEVWLKEVFANFMADKIADPLFPDLNHDVRFFLSHYPSAYRVDRTQGTNPIEQKLENLNQASTLYGDIIYDKAPVAMKQLEKYMGPENFHKGLQEYLHKFQFKNASWSDLIGILGRHTGKPLKKWNHDWIESSGEPTLSTRLDLKKSRIVLKSGDPGGRHLTWPQTLNLVLGSAESTVILPVTSEGPETKIKSDHLPRGVRFILTDARDPGYGLFLLDPKTIDYLSGHLREIKDEDIRAVAWVDVLQNMVERKILPEYFIDLVIKMLPDERNEQIIDLALRNTGYVYWALLSDEAREKFVAPLEKMLWDQIHNAALSKFARTSFFKAYETVLTSVEAWSHLHDIWSEKEKIEDIRFSESDFMEMAYELTLRKPSAGPSIIQKQLDRIKDPERKSEFSFVIRAAAGSQPERDEMFHKLVSDEAYRKNEPWVRDALYYLNHPLHGIESEKYVKESLEILPAIRQTGGIFFPLSWLYGALGFHINQNTRTVVEDYLNAHKNLERGLRLKVLQAADILMRFTKD